MSNILNCSQNYIAQDGRIIVYGGLTEDGGPAKDDLVILDTSQAVYTWSKANVSTNKPLPRYSIRLLWWVII
ncbi:uncharacterized protein OCT59_017803 [Rhizophagus irregularis]|uniref:Uncharacterized protein n=1 Tax=Rhizophagus irregularis (strain DAOM 197198w) TaxID=1432141 RepID=A0A015JW84_RHIIW|nr:hypothetical protein RirG_189770 [Rhizophagus irregularis DAOM 197198w]UZO25538.1 hypothetical protein OCT59_017803 [Rhizophagus irregularis]